MPPDNDSELAVNVKAAKNRRMHFAFVAAGGSDGALVLSKTEIPPVLITAAKKKSGGTQVVKGMCFGEDRTLVFEMTKEPPATMAATLKKVIHRDANLVQHCECRVGTNPDLAERGEAVAPATAAPTGKPAATTTPPAAPPKPAASPSPTAPQADYASLYVKLEAAIEPQLKHALQEKLGDTEKLKTVFHYARDQMAKKEYGKAIQGLQSLGKLLAAGQAPPAGTSTYTPLEAAAGNAPEEEPPVLTPDRIESQWADAIDLGKYTQKFQSGKKPPKGSFGEVRMLESKDPNAPPLAIKIPLAAGGIADLQKEVAYYKQVGDHPNFAKCLGIADVAGMRGLVLEQVKGKDMGKTLNKLQEEYANGNLAHADYWGAVQHTMRQTLQAIAHLEEVGIVHNDIRLDNIMCDQTTGQMKVIDFGVSVQAGEVPDTFPLRHGTVSPDVLDRDEAGNWTGGKAGLTAKHDVFGVGAAAYQAGEKKGFDYHSGFGQGFIDDLVKFGQYQADGTSKQAIRPADEANPAFQVTKQHMGPSILTKEKKTPEKVAGRSGADTAYTEFVNRLMDANPNNRLSPAAALLDKFLADSLLDEEQACKVLKKLLAPPSAAAAEEPADDDDKPESEEDEFYVRLKDEGESSEDTTTHTPAAGTAPAAGGSDDGSYTQLGQQQTGSPAQTVQQSPDSGSYTQLGQQNTGSSAQNVKQSPDSGSYTQLGANSGSPAQNANQSGDSGSYKSL